ncbi:MAG: hypothetical protein K0U78_21525 [Actinomycetia bacterium]|nr:hypothetical protein [Actinomycetes bacterium]
MTAENALGRAALSMFVSLTTQAKPSRRETESVLAFLAMCLLCLIVAAPAGAQTESVAADCASEISNIHEGVWLVQQKPSWWCTTTDSAHFRRPFANPARQTPMLLIGAPRRETAQLPPAFFVLHSRSEWLQQLQQSLEGESQAPRQFFDVNRQIARIALVDYEVNAQKLTPVQQTLARQLRRAGWEYIDLASAGVFHNAYAIYNRRTGFAAVDGVSLRQYLEEDTEHARTIQQIPQREFLESYVQGLTKLRSLSEIHASTLYVHGITTQTGTQNYLLFDTYIAEMLLLPRQLSIFARAGITLSEVARSAIIVDEFVADKRAFLHVYYPLLIAQNTPVLIAF